MGPKAGFYSPLSCANCHTQSNEDLLEVYRTPSAYVKPPELPLSENLLSPSECPAEIFWPPPLTTYRGFVQKNPYLRSQNYLTTLLASRRGQFPAQIAESYLEIYLGLKRGTSLPVPVGSFGVQLASDAQVCAGPPLPADTSAEKCTGWRMNVQDEDFGVLLTNQNWISAGNLAVELKGIAGDLLSGVQIDSLALRDGRLLVSVKVVNPLLNSAVPWFTETLKPNPFSPELYDLDLTDILLKKLPVAYDPRTRKALNDEAYQANPSKEGLALLPYFYPWVRQGRLPERLSINRLYETVTELLSNVDRDVKSSGDWSELFRFLRIHGKILPTTFIHPKLYAEFSSKQGENELELAVEVDGRQTPRAYLLAPIHLERLLLPGILDVLDLQGRLEAVIKGDQDTQIFLHDLDMELGRTEFFGRPDKAGNLAVLGGFVRRGREIDGVLLEEKPALTIQGDPGSGWNVRINLSLAGVKLRLPWVGEISLSGDLSAEFHVVADQAWVLGEDGNYFWGNRLKLDSRGLRIRLENGVVEREGVWSAKKIAWELRGPEDWQSTARDSADSHLSFQLDAPEIQGGSYQRLAVGGEIKIPTDSSGYFDFSRLLEKPESRWEISATRVSGEEERWNLSWNGSTEAGKHKHELHLGAKLTSPASSGERPIVEDLRVELSRENLATGSRYEIRAAAKQLDFTELHLSHPELAVHLDWHSPEFGPALLVVPVLRFSANRADRSPRNLYGLLRGPIWIKNLPSERKPLSIRLVPEAHTLEIKNLKLDLGIQKITPAALSKATKGKISSVDIDGRLDADWTLDYLANRGKGLIQLVGDGEGDVHLRNATGHRMAKPDPRDEAFLVETPMFANTVWKLTRIRKIDEKNHRVLGDFKLKTEIDPAIARNFGIVVDSGKVVSWEMNHDHLPYTPLGFFQKMSEYLLTKFRQDATGGTP